MSETAKKRIPLELFKESSPEGAEGQHLSLHSYIKQHLQTQLDTPALPAVPELESTSVDMYDDEPLVPVAPTHAWESRAPQGGFQINANDTEWSAGIEQYLPTPSVRFRVIKERLRREISELHTRLVRYQSIENPPPDVQEKIDGLQKRLQTLRQHEAEVSQELSNLYSQTSRVFEVTARLGELKRTSTRAFREIFEKTSPLEWIRQVDPQRHQLAEMNQHLNDLVKVLSEQSRQNTLSPVEVSKIINQYDNTMRQVEGLIEVLQNRPSFWQRVGSQVKNAYKQLA